MMLSSMHNRSTLNTVSGSMATIRAMLTAFDCNASVHFYFINNIKTT